MNAKSERNNTDVLKQPLSKLIKLFCYCFILLQRKTQQSFSNLKRSSHDEVQRYATNMMTNSRITFLSEKDCETPGGFRERMKKLGYESNIGVSMPELIYHGRLKNSNCTQSEPIIHKSRQPLLKSPKNRSNTAKAKGNPVSLPRTQAWQPLTLSALSEYTNSIPGPGSGEFRKGSVKMWKSSMSMTNDDDT